MGVRNTINQNRKMYKLLNIQNRYIYILNYTSDSSELFLTYSSELHRSERVVLLLNHRHETI